MRTHQDPPNAREEHEVSNEKTSETISPKRSEIADALTNAAAGITGLNPEQIITISAGTEQILIGYIGARPGLIGGSGRIAVQTWDTRTGRLLSDEVADRA
jgi:hypothetical protein